MFVCVSGHFEVVSATVNHYRNGMRANYTVEKCGMFQRQAEVMLHSKTYYIAAMEMDWDYSPNRTWEAEMFRGQERYSTTCWTILCLLLFMEIFIHKASVQNISHKLVPTLAFKIGNNVLPIFTPMQHILLYKRVSLSSAVLPLSSWTSRVGL